LKEHAERHKRPRSAEEDRRNLAIHVLPKWGRRDFRAIRRADAVELIESIVSAGKHGAGNRIHALVSKIFSFGIDAGLLESNPVARLRKRGIENVGRRVLSDDEICWFWHNIVLPSKRIGLALRLALLTAARATEVAGARKTEFQNLHKPEQATWLIPGGRRKNKRDHSIFLAPLAVETIKNAIDLTGGDNEFVFPGRGGRGAVDRHTLASAMRRSAMTAPATWRQEPPSPHDLRRTVNTRLAKIGVPKEVRDRALGHATGMRDPEARHYNLHEYQAERRESFARWAAEIEALIKPAPVVPIRVKGRRP